MKKSIFSYFSYLVLLLLAVGTLSSCGDGTEDPSAAPSITVNPESATIDVNQSVDFTFQVISTESELSEVRIIYTGQPDQVFTPATDTFTDNNTRFSGVYTFTGMLADAASSVTFTIKATDMAGLTSSKDVVVTINEAPDPIAYETFPVILLGAQANTANGSFLDASTSAIYKLAEARTNSALIDIAYLQGSQSAGQGAVIGSLRDASIEQVYSTSDWGTRNDTRFRNTTLTKADFTAIFDGSQLTTAYTNGSEPSIGETGDIKEGSASRVNKLAVDDVFAFRTADGKDGLVHVQQIVTGESGSITLNVSIVK
ncbi:hypothetical protein V9L05_13030 [Bernardetia sp. Wsw4-3y2]|uniref:hypothetical protein n=1 Tax=Bernardetia sp. Wsw4-3y2 TaxID=3127471 RepID=UPI0030CC7593